MKNKKNTFARIFTLALAILFFSLNFIAGEPATLGSKVCSDLGSNCFTKNSCCPTYLTDHGLFYGYCDSPGSNTCEVADGLNGNLNILDWCNRHVAGVNSVPGDPNYRSFNGKNFLGWTEGTCDNLFYLVSGATVGTNPGFYATYDYKNNRISTFDENGVELEKNYYDVLGYGRTYASESSVSGLSFSATDPMGRTHSGIDANGNKVKNYYDGLDRLVVQEFFNKQGAKEGTVNYCYDEYCNDGGYCSFDRDDSSFDGEDSSFNFLCEINDNMGKVKFKYDKRGRVTWQEKTIKDRWYGDRVYALEFEYNSGNLLTRMKLPDNTHLNYKYNSLGQIIKIEHESPTGIEDVTELYYNAAGMIEQKTLAPNDEANKIVADYTYDKKQQLIAMNFIQAGDPIFQRGMKYDKVGNILDISYAVNPANPFTLVSQDESFAYDYLYRLVTAAYSGDRVFNYYYKNMLGDRDKIETTTSPEPTTYIYEGGKLKSYSASGTSTATLTYDSTGNIISELSSSGNSAYNYDAMNRMTTSTSNGQTVRNYYDYTNKRIKKETDYETTFYLYQGNNVIYEETVTSTQKRCSDSTPSGYCSGSNLCEKGSFVPKCKVCGCPKDTGCSANGKCVAPVGRGTTNPGGNLGGSG